MVVSRKISENTLLTFQKAQSEFLGLTTPATTAELIKLGNLSKRSRQPFPFKICKRNPSNPENLSWHIIRKKAKDKDDETARAEARQKYNDMMSTLKKKYNGPQAPPDDNPSQPSDEIDALIDPQLMSDEGTDALIDPLLMSA